MTDHSMTDRADDQPAAPVKPMSVEQVCALAELMREHDAADATPSWDRGSSTVLHVALSRDDEDSFCATGTISVAGTVRLDVRVAA